jgi:hypothetical protein
MGSGFSGKFKEIGKILVILIAIVFLLFALNEEMAPLYNSAKV